MSEHFRRYAPLLVVFVLSFGLALFLPTTELLRGMAGTPAIGALILALWQLFRDEAAHEKQLELENQKQFFSLSVTSHMANVAFDKHVTFSEEYVAEVIKGTQEMGRDGPNPNALKFANNLTLIRLKHAPWVSDKITAELEKLEKALRTVGALTGLLESSPPAMNRQQVVAKAWGTYLAVLGESVGPGESNPEIAADRAISHLRSVLGISELTQLRQKIIERAAASVVLN